VSDGDDPYDMECPICGGCLIERDHARSWCPGPEPSQVYLKALMDEFYSMKKELKFLKEEIVRLNSLKS
jgi:hypothetical protein